MFLFRSSKKPEPPRRNQKFKHIVNAIIALFVAYALMKGSSQKDSAIHKSLHQIEENYKEIIPKTPVIQKPNPPLQSGKGKAKTEPHPPKTNTKPQE